MCGRRVSTQRPRLISTVSDRPGYTFGYIPRQQLPRPEALFENRCPPSQLVVMRWLHTCRSTKVRRVWWSPRTLAVADGRASFRPSRTQAAVPYETLVQLPLRGRPLIRFM